MDGGQIAGALAVAVFSGYNFYTGKTQGRIWTKRGSVLESENPSTFKVLFGLYGLMAAGGLGAAVYGLIQNAG